MIMDLKTTTLMNPLFELALTSGGDCYRALTLIGFLPRISGLRGQRRMVASPAQLWVTGKTAQKHGLFVSKELALQINALFEILQLFD
jgi:hypothetical protein